MAIPLSLSNVPDATPYIQYVASGGQTVYPYPFPITQDSDLVVVINGVTQNTDSTYSLSGQGNPTGGNVTLDNGSTAGDIVTLYRDIQIERLTQFSQNGGFASSAFNAEFNNLYLIAQQLEASIAQCLQVPNTNNPSPATLLVPSAYAGNYLSFDVHGNPAPAALTLSGAVTLPLLQGLLYPDNTPHSTAFGYKALANNGTQSPPGNNNTAFGYGALQFLSGGASNPTGSTAVGYLALQNSNGATNTAIGDNTMASDLTGSDNTAVGAQALFSETNSTGNNCFGFQCGYYITTGVSNLLLGNYAGGGVSGPGTGVGLTTGSNNVGVGGGALANLGNGSNNTAIGLGALLNNIGGNSNVAVGYLAGTHANSSNEFYLDNQDRGINANEVANAPIYGNFGATAATNRLRFNAQLYASIGNLSSFNAAPTIASAATIAPTAMITFVSGVAAIATISVPFWMAGGSRVTLIPTGVFTWGTSSNIALGGTAVVGKALDFIFDNGTGKWYPSYIA